MGFVALAALLHHDHVTIHTVDAGAAQYTASAIVVSALVALAFTPVGRPLPPRAGASVPTPQVCVLVGLFAMAAFDLVPASWAGVVIDLLMLATVLGLLAWSPRHLAAVAFGALAARTIVGMFAPLPTQTTWAEKIGQHVIYVVLILALGWAMRRRTTPAT